MSQPRPKRSNDAILRLARTVAEEALSSPAIDTSTGDVRFGVEIAMTPTTTAMGIDEPERRPLRDFLVVLRKFDSPTHDVFLDKVYAILKARAVKPDWSAGLAEARTGWADRNEVREFHIQEIDEPPSDNPTWIRPRKAFELWLDGEVIHDDYSKQELWGRMGPLHQGLVRKMAHGYMFELILQADFMARLLRNGLIESLGP
jgi:hypothetical protein